MGPIDAMRGWALFLSSIQDVEVCLSIHSFCPAMPGSTFHGPELNSPLTHSSGEAFSYDTHCQHWIAPIAARGLFPMPVLGGSDLEELVSVVE